MTKSRMKMCDGSEYTVFYLCEKETSSLDGLKVNDLRPNNEGQIFEGHIFNLNKKDSVFHKLFCKTDDDKN
jgi:hypothetical protein